jgi:hypothetical protein
MNQYRCETCKILKCYHHPQNFRGAGCWSLADHDHEWKFTKEYGCTLHSDFQNEREKVSFTPKEIIDIVENYRNQIKSEREKVLDELVAWRKKQPTSKCSEKSDWLDIWFDEDNFIEELRGEQ